MTDPEERSNSKRRLRPYLRIIIFAFVTSLFVFIAALVLQWIVYDDWLHQRGLRILGTSIAAIIAFFFVLRWQLEEVAKQQAMLRRFARIHEMNDKIRNALQIIECTTYVSQPDATAHIHEAVNAIDIALRQISTDKAFSVAGRKKQSASVFDVNAKGNSA